MDKTSLENLLKDKDFVKKISEMETPEEVQRSFKENNIDFSIDEIKLIGKIVNEYIEKLHSLPEEELSKISGGSVGEFIEGIGLGALDTIPGGGLAYKLLTGDEIGWEIDSTNTGIESGNIGYHASRAIFTAGLIAATSAIVYKNPKVVKWVVDKTKSVGSNIKGKIKKLKG